MKKPNQYSESELNKIWQQNLTGWGSKTFFEPFISPINKYLFENKCSGSLLDLGCGSGCKSIVFDKIGFNVTGIDADAKRISRANLKFPQIDFRCDKIKTNLPFDDNSFDVIFSCSVFQYLPHKPLLKECKRVLKKGGSIIMVENLKKNPVTSVGRTLLKCVKYNYQSYPWNHFTLSEIEKLKTEFNNPTYQINHFLSPLSEIKVFNKLYKSLFKIDQKILQINAFKDLAWLVLFTGEKK